MDGVEKGNVKTSMMSMPYEAPTSYADALNRSPNTTCPKFSTGSLSADMSVGSQKSKLWRGEGRKEEAEGGRGGGA